MFHVERNTDTRTRASDPQAVEPASRTRVREVPRPKIIALANQKGGVGKTTTAINLAVGIALAGKRCLLVDLDPQANASSGLGIAVKRRGGSHFALISPNRTEEAIVPTMVDGLDILPSHPSLVQLERELQGASDRERRLQMALIPVATRYQYILIDCPPSLGLFPANAFLCCDSVLIPIQCEYYAMEGLAQILADVEKSKRMNSRLSVEGVLLTMFEPESAFAHEVANEVRTHLGEVVYDSIVPRDVALAEAPSHGKAILQYAPRSRGARGYVELTRELLMRQNSNHTPEETKANDEA